MRQGHEAGDTCTEHEMSTIVHRMVQGITVKKRLISHLTVKILINCQLSVKPHPDTR